MSEPIHLDWLYLFTNKDEYPDPLEEIDALCSFDADDQPMYLLLADRKSPPLSGATCGEVIGLCTSQKQRLILHGTAVVDGKCITGGTPPSVEPIYGDLPKRVFCPLKDLQRLPSSELPVTVLSNDNQQNFLRGQAFAKRLNSGSRSSRKPAVVGPPRADSLDRKLTFPSLVFSQKSSAFTVVGLDPTAGTWDSRMTQGSKKMPSFALRWEQGFRPAEQPLAWHMTNDEFQAEVNNREAVLTCIDGPCGTNGPRLLRDGNPWCWDPNAPNESREGELKLSRQGVNLFWTTQNTVMAFDGASRWIARSLTLFAENAKKEKIETHPHGAFTFLWRMFGETKSPPKKSTTAGRNARLSLLRSFIPRLSDEMVPNHDALDAACAALVAGLHRLELTIAFGTPDDGGEIWMPDSEKLRALFPTAINEAEKVAADA
jgi:hypothetical protein